MTYIRHYVTMHMLGLPAGELQIRRLGVGRPITPDRTRYMCVTPLIWRLIGAESSASIDDVTPR